MDATKDLEKQSPANFEAPTKDGTRKSVFSRFNFLHLGRRDPPPPKPSFDEANIIPEANANWLSLLTFAWVGPIIRLGYSRTLEATDLYKLQDDRSSHAIAEKITCSFEERQRKAAEYNSRLANGEISPGLKGIWWSIRGQRQKREMEWREKTGKKKASLAMAANDSVFWFFWSAGIFRLVSDVAQITSPLFVKAIIQFAQHSCVVDRTRKTTPSTKDGVSLALGLLFLQTLSSFAMNHFLYRAMSTGVLLRAGLITAIYNKALTLSTHARDIHPSGKLVDHISTDISRIDFACQLFHIGWTAPIQLIICLGILLVNLGPSTLAGFAVFLIVMPIQIRLMRFIPLFRQRAMVFTDMRTKLLQELLPGTKMIKFSSWGDRHLDKIRQVRDLEIRNIRSFIMLRAAITSMAIPLPLLASIPAFIIYGINHLLDPAIIATSSTLLNMLRLPLMSFPTALAASVDAYNAFSRIQEVFEAESLTDEHVWGAKIENALELDDASFRWDASPPKPEGRNGEGAKDLKKEKSGKEPEICPLVTVSLASSSVPGSPRVSISHEPEQTEKVFKIQKTNLRIPRGWVVAIVGPVGSGKFSFLQALIGEMRKETGSVRFGGSVSYCPRNGWIQNATIRENVCFGKSFDSEKYFQATSASCLDADLKLFPNGDLTEVGERGIALSDCQKQRISICRAIYCGAEVQLFDDPLSTLDPRVTKTVFQRVFANNPEGQTKIFTTHVLHFLPRVDYICMVDDGQIVERGTYTKLMANRGVFSKFVRQFSSKQREEEKEDAAEIVSEVEVEEEERGNGGHNPVAALGEQYEKGKETRQEEERNVSAVAWEIYKTYLAAGNGHILVPSLLLSLLLLQGAQIVSSYWLVFWNEQLFDQPVGYYMGIYAALGVSPIIMFFITGAVVGPFAYFASKSLHHRIITSIVYAPISFFDTTPPGRIMNEFSKDIDTIDNATSDSLRVFLLSSASIVGSFVLIATIVPWFLVAVGVIAVVYYVFALYYRASVRKLKRLDSILRSSLYAHFSESLTGLTTIRACGETERFRKESEDRMNIENRAYWLMVASQRWIGIRIDMLGLLLTFIVAVLTVIARFSISPSQIGLALNYIITVQQALGILVRQFTELESDMNSVERVIHYAKNLEQESPHEIPGGKPEVPWPTEGRIEIKNVFLKYRPESPDVLSGLTMDVTPGEKIGIVGGTGTEKSSIVTALYRLVGLSSGSILIDGVDISTIGLKDLWSALAIIPRDPLLFSGTLRSNLDPFGQFEDAKLWDALKRSRLVDDTKQDATEEGDLEAAVSGRFILDTVIENEGGNLSASHRLSVSLARALLRETKVLILDEATASVDHETDKKVQDAIAAEFGGRTVLCITNRLQNIVGYDRICVMDAGRIAEFDTPTRLFSIEGGIFRGMCDRSKISLEDIQRAAKLRET